MSTIVFASGIKNYEESSKEWASSENSSIKDVKEKIDNLMTLKTMSYPACGTQEIMVLSEMTELELDAFKNLSTQLRGWLKSQDRQEYKVARTVSLW